MKSKIGIVFFCVIVLSVVIAGCAPTNSEDAQTDKAQNSQAAIAVDAQVNVTTPQVNTPDANIPSVEVPAVTPREDENVTATIAITSETQVQPNQTVTPPEPKVNDTFHTILITPKGFSPATIEIKVGDTIEWKNTRTDPKLKQAMVVGAQLCSKVKSGFLKSGETYRYTFETPQKCTIVDGIVTTQISTVIVK